MPKFEKETYNKLLQELKNLCEFDKKRHFSSIKSEQDEILNKSKNYIINEETLIITKEDFKSEDIEKSEREKIKIIKSEDMEEINFDLTLFKNINKIIMPNLSKLPENFPGENIEIYVNQETNCKNIIDKLKEEKNLKKFTSETIKLFVKGKRYYHLYKFDDKSKTLTIIDSDFKSVYVTETHKKDTEIIESDVDIYHITFNLNVFKNLNKIIVSELCKLPKSLPNNDIEVYADGYYNCKCIIDKLKKEGENLKKFTSEKIKLFANGERYYYLYKFDDKSKTLTIIDSKFILDNVIERHKEEATIIKSNCITEINFDLNEFRKLERIIIPNLSKLPENLPDNDIEIHVNQETKCKNIIDKLKKEGENLKKFTSEKIKLFANGERYYYLYKFDDKSKTLTIIDSKFILDNVIERHKEEATIIESDCITKINFDLTEFKKLKKIIMPNLSELPENLPDNDIEIHVNQETKCKNIIDKLKKEGENLKKFTSEKIKLFANGERYYYLYKFDDKSKTLTIIDSKFILDNVIERHKEEATTIKSSCITKINFDLTEFKKLKKIIMPNLSELSKNLPDNDIEIYVNQKTNCKNIIDKLEEENLKKFTSEKIKLFANGGRYYYLYKFYNENRTMVIIDSQFEVDNVIERHKEKAQMIYSDCITEINFSLEKFSSLREIECQLLNKINTKFHDENIINIYAEYENCKSIVTNFNEENRREFEDCKIKLFDTTYNSVYIDKSSYEFSENTLNIKTNNFDINKYMLNIEESNNISKTKKIESKIVKVIKFNHLDRFHELEEIRMENLIAIKSKFSEQVKCVSIYTKKENCKKIIMSFDNDININMFKGKRIKLYDIDSNSEYKDEYSISSSGSVLCIINKDFKVSSIENKEKIKTIRYFDEEIKFNFEDFPNLNKIYVPNLTVFPETLPEKINIYTRSISKCRDIIINLKSNSENIKFYVNNKECEVDLYYKLEGNVLKVDSSIFKPEYVKNKDVLKVQKIESKFRIEASISDFSRFKNLQTISECDTIIEYTTKIEKEKYKNKFIKKAILPNAIEIEMEAFCKCRRLKTVEIPKVKTIERGVFGYCESLKTIVIPDSIEEIKEDTFRESGLEEIILNKVTSIKQCAFCDCENLTKVKIPEIDNIGPFAFYGCMNLREIDISKVKTIGKNAFSNCPLLKKIKISNEGQRQEVINSLGTEKIRYDNKELEILYN